MVAMHEELFVAGKWELRKQEKDGFSIQRMKITKAPDTLAISSHPTTHIVLWMEQRSGLTQSW